MIKGHNVLKIDFFGVYKSRLKRNSLSKEMRKYQKAILKNEDHFNVCFNFHIKVTISITVLIFLKYKKLKGISLFSLFF